ncbi:hypothetical protein IEQ34_002908 [Dendrobium chrysotoxum]|uniref:K+ potassium transporter integral membrane domain-containing protein n=1 Tax=Dendrobium chrysotoxum TaxID=161865 RepID=A0AAV7HIC4_DENCH|nr:hypothetical protein IEQ34_002908 [Dendrobium chrysotoxum]
MGDDVVLNIETVGSEPMEKNGEPVEEVHEEEKQKKKPFHSLDSFDKEANKISSLHSASKVVSIATVLQLAIQSIGVVYGDIGTSPLYVFSSTFLNRVPSKNDVVGALSLIIYTLTLFPLIKYVFIVLWANDNGDGGTFALYSLICRNSKVSAIPNERQEEMELSAYKLKMPNKNLKRAQRIKEALESSCWAKTSLLSMALLGTFLSPVDGVRKFDTGMSKDIVAMISIFILVMLFSIQRFGTDKVSYSFAFSILLWFMLIGSIGIFNIFRHDSTVLKAFNTIYIISYFKRDPKAAWISLGGVVLCMTGTEAMFADLGHFSVRSIQVNRFLRISLSMFDICLCWTSCLSIFPKNITDAFYKSIPESVYWPMFVASVMASIIASQAMISATFAIIKQSMALGCFPRVRVIHTSHKHEGHVYIPETNFLLMLACVLVTPSFKEPTNIGNAYGMNSLYSHSKQDIITLFNWQIRLIATNFLKNYSLSFESYIGSFHESE